MNAVKTRIWIAIAVYVSVAMVKKRLNIEASRYTILRILSLILFEKTLLDQLVKNTEIQMNVSQNNNQGIYSGKLPDTTDHTNKVGQPKRITTGKPLLARYVCKVIPPPPQGEKV